MQPVNGAVGYGFHGAYIYDIIIYRIVVKSTHIGESREAEMDIKEAIKERHSVRQFQDIPVTEVDREKLIELIDACNAESGLHIQLILNNPDCFNTFLAHYGKFTNANNYIALVGKGSYYGESRTYDEDRPGYSEI